MNCCDYGCNQGPDCPARVAKAKPVMQAAEPLPPSTWRDKLKKACEWGLWAVLGTIAAVQLSLICYIFYLAYFAFRE
jgi:hypothetical protein